jgi:hypothetical protein
MEFWADGAAGIIKTWTNGNLIHNITDFQKANVSDGLTIGLVGFDPSLGASITSWLDDIYASPYRARVELSSEALWSNTGGSREVQIVTGWADGQVQFDLNLGALSSSNPLYLYVVNNQGDVNPSGQLLSDFQ